MQSFHTADEAEIRAGATTDIYFRHTEEVLRQRGLLERRAHAEVTTGGLPENWPWGVLCGLDEALSLLEGREVDIDALPEGTLFPARDRRGRRIPVLTLEGPYGAYCIYETPLLGFLCQATGVATRAARIRLAAGDASVLSFGARRMHPAIAPMIDRAAWVGGCDGISCILSAERLGITPTGTMPHALMILFEDQAEAWRAFDETMPPEVPRIALVDTYWDEKAEAIIAAETLGEALYGVRLDTPGSRRGNFVDIVREVRWELDLRGFNHVRIFVSGSLDEKVIPALAAAGAVGFGVGTHLSNAPTVDFALDIVSLEGAPVAKRGKLSGRKQVYHCSGCGEWEVDLREMPPPACPGCDTPMRPMLRRWLDGGRRTAPTPSPTEIREYVLRQLSGATLDGSPVSRGR
ncbi:MAG TPA: nicotinate phosphoribosyltransferase [Armatimonadota bacterium]|nr:nicotinate phosphoribosyltransferase [Armatimonadota bacterium]HOJ22426.1 nicotinate phosphoribosyltransferase [Armatimonadota bacterium]HOM83410.1 nicotinate phosphoribosyltransferase [Armatimonadota bacterium]HOQ28967.1 nicotinate phosphoribosyltransferase [Armatimonadota bacterium]HPO74949.1 nicotinate phosphoribosyltransferase [Armatimonadota bacterium]